MAIFYTGGIFMSKKTDDFERSDKKDNFSI